MDEPAQNGPEAAGVSARVPCPVCGETNLSLARRCLKCGEVLPAVATTKPRRWGCGTIIAALVIGAALILLLLPFGPRRAREAARRSQCKNNLKQIGLALQRYHEEYDAFPPPYTVAPDGRRLHSWRTLLLPYLDQQPLYEQIDLTKPWDDPVHRAAVETSLPVFRCPSAAQPDNHTSYMVIVSPGGCFREGNTTRLEDIKDGTSETLLAIEVPTDLSVPWMAPQDADEALFLNLTAASKLAHVGGMQVVHCDGSVRFLSVQIPPSTRRALITIAGRDLVGDF